MATYAKPKPNQGPAMGGEEVPGTPNSSPSTAATDGFYQAAQALGDPAPGWNEISAPEAPIPSLGQRTAPQEPAVRVLGKLMRGVY